MTYPLKELYQQAILEHARRPRNFYELANATHHLEGYNPLCGDRISVYCLVANDNIVQISFTGSGCAICTASASMMTEQLKGKPTQQGVSLFMKFRDLLTSSMGEDDFFDKLDKLVVFAGVREFPMRVKCATLPWHTMKAAIDNQQETVTTE